MEKRWIFTGGGLEAAPFKLADDAIKSILSARGISDDEGIAEFLSDKPQQTYDPFLLMGMDNAVDRILKAVDQKEQICIYGDYDADGVCSVSLLLDILGKLTDRLSYYIPSRFDEGYGLNKDAIYKLKERGAQLIITVDCGSTSVAETDLAKELGIDIVVTDHHNMGDTSLNCIVVNPKQPGCPYPFKHLSGCGVAFKLSQGLKHRLDQRDVPLLMKRDLNRVLDLVALATIGDIVSLSGENRTLVKYGMKAVNNGYRPGLKKLIETAGLTPGKIKAENVAYILVPHLNAGGRMFSAKTGVTLLTSDDPSEFTKAANRLASDNTQRKSVQEQTFLQCSEIVEERHKDDHFLVIEAGDAHEGIAGIVAGKIKDVFYHPTVIVTNVEGGKLKGTGRSIEGVDLYVLLSEFGHLFEKFGGHSGACGFTMKEEHLNDLRAGLNHKVQELYDKEPDRFVPKLMLEGELSLAGIDFKLVEILEKLEPFGMGNPKPLFCATGLSVESHRRVGDRGQHMQFTVCDNRGGKLDCVVFGQSEERLQRIESGKLLDIAGYPDINSWKGSRKIQFMVSDFR